MFSWIWYQIPEFWQDTKVCTLGWAPWNLSCLEFKFNDTRLSSWYKNKIGSIEIFVCCVLTLLSLCPVGCLSLEKLNWDSQQVRDLATSGRNKQKFQLGQSYSYIMRKVWYHQIWIQNNLGFMVLILMYISTYKAIFENLYYFIDVFCSNRFKFLHVTVLFII